MKTLKKILIVSLFPLAMACNSDPMGPSDDQQRVDESGVVVHRPQTSGVILNGPRRASLSIEEVEGEWTRKGLVVQSSKSAPGIGTSP